MKLHDVVLSTLIIVQGFFISKILSMPTVEVPPTVQGDSLSIPSMSTSSTLPQAIPPGQPQMQAITADAKVVQPSNQGNKQEKKGREAIAKSEDKPSILQMKELKFVNEGLKGAGKVIDLFVGPFEEFGDVIPPTISSLFGPVAHIHWSLIIRSLQKRIKKARADFAVLTGQLKSVEIKPKKTEQPVDFMVAMQQEIKKKEPEQKQKINLKQLMPKPILKKIHDAALDFVKKATKPIEKKSLAVAELFEPLPPIPFLVTLSDIQLALHILSLQQRAAVIEESLRNKLESLADIKKRELKGAIKVADLDPMVAMVAVPEPTPEQKKKAEDQAKKKKEKNEEVSRVKLKDTKEMSKVYSAFKSLNEKMSPMTQSIEKLTQDIPAMPVPLVSFLASLLILSGGTVGATGVVASFTVYATAYGVIAAALGGAVATLGGALYGISQAQFAIYIRNLQELLGKIEADIKNYQDAKKLAVKSSLDSAKIPEQAPAEMARSSTEEALALPEASGSQLLMPEAGTTDVVVDAAKISDADGVVPAE